jgi:thiosulfate sulfurtransferase
MAVEMGYSNVKVYRDGIPGWARAGYPLVSTASYPKVDIPLVDAAQLHGMNRNSVFLVDTRPAGTFAKGHIEGAVNIDLEDLHDSLNLLPADKKIVLIDHKGKTTLITGRYLNYKGYGNLARLDGGFNAWAKTSYPIALAE